MDPTAYKDVTTSRGLKYHYFHSPSRNSKPTLLFLHGFPSTSYDWRYQVPFFQEEGYGLIVPDTLGYGGTDKPKDTALYKWKAMCADVIEVLNAEGVDKVIAIGHDWGSVFVSRLALYHPHRFLGFAFLAVAYFPPYLGTLSALADFSEKTFGYVTFGYWHFFSEDSADTIIESHFESFFSMVFPHDPELWKTDMGPVGKLKAWILADKKGPLPPYLTEADKQKAKQDLLSGGFAAPLNYYKVAVSGISAEEEKTVSQERYAVNHPVFFAGATKDYVCRIDGGKAAVGRYCKNATIKDFDTDHWVQLAVPDELNAAILAWIKQIEI